MTSALAEDVAAVLIDRVGDPQRTDRVDQAMADAVVAIEALVAGEEPAPAVVAVAELAAGLLVDLRHGHLDRIACRVAAPTVIERLGRCLGVDAAIASAAPVLALLAAVADVPDGERPGPDAIDAAIDAAADPASPLEVALGDFLAGAASRPELLDALATATVHVPVLHAAVQEDRLALRLVPMVLREGVVACAFTSEGRAHGLPTLEVAGGELAAFWPPRHGLVLNPGAVLGTVLHEREVRALPFRP